MSLKRGKHLLRTEFWESVPGQLGQPKWIPTGESVEFRVNRHPSTEEEIVSFGFAASVVLETVYYYGPDWPGSIHDRYFLLDREWDLVKPPKFFDNGNLTSHYRAVLRERK